MIITLRIMSHHKFAFISQSITEYLIIVIFLKQKRNISVKD